MMMLMMMMLSVSAIFVHDTSSLFHNAIVQGGPAKVSMLNVAITL